MGLKVMSRYANGKIYAIRSHQTDNVYIGSTCNALYKRLYTHRKFKKIFDTGVGGNYTTSFDILSYDDHYIELIENCPCDSKIELHRREGQIIRETENCVNKYIAGRTKAEYRRDNADKLKEINKEYRQANADEIREKKKAYRQANVEQIKEKDKAYYKANVEKIKAQHKAYYKANSGRLKERDKAYRQANSEHIREKHTCPCGGKYTTNHKSTHYKSIKHMKFEQEQTN